MKGRAKVAETIVNILLHLYLAGPSLEGVVDTLISREDDNANTCGHARVICARLFAHIKTQDVRKH